MRISTGRISGIMLLSNCIQLHSKYRAPEVHRSCAVARQLDLGGFGLKRYFGITLGGLQKKTIMLVLMILLITVAVFAGISIYQNRMLVRIVGETRNEQQQAISQVSQDTMHQILTGTLVTSTTLRADLADSDFSEIVNNAYMLQTMAQGLLENRDIIEPLLPSLPDPALDGTVSAMVLCDEGVDYTQSEYLGAIGHMSSAMIAMQTNSDKISACYVGLTDGTHLGIDGQTLDKYDANGNLIPFPVTKRPWFKGAVETGDLYFTGIEKDAFNGEICVTCSIPVWLNGEIVGVAGLDIVLENMRDFVRHSSGQGSYSYVINNRSQVILGPEDGGILPVGTPDQAAELQDLGNEALSQFAETALREATELTTITIDGKPYYLAGAPMPTIGWAVITVVEKGITEQPEKKMLEEYDRINLEASTRFNNGSAKLGRTILLVLICELLIGVLAAMVAARRIVKPIERMTDNIVRSSKTGELFKMDSQYRTNDEIELLAEAFDDLSKKTKNYIEQITKITAEKERISTELSLATRIQAAMLPHVFPPFPGRPEIDLYASMDPAKEVGGDFYDYFLVDDDHLCLLIADIAGKGVPAALFMMASKIILQNYAMLGKSPAEILTMTNRAICSNNQEEMFFTVWLGILEISTGKLTAANAGHEYPMIKKPDGSFQLVKDKHGLVIGAFDSVKYKDYEIQMEPGSKLFVYTDGVPEATNADNTLFGTDRMLTALNKEPGALPEEILKNVRITVDSFVKEADQFDDLTMLCLEYNGVHPVFELTLDAVQENLPHVQAFLEKHLEAAGCPVKTLTQISIAVEEVFINIASYAYLPGTGDVTIRMALSRKPSSVTISFMDHGIPFNPLAKADPDVTLMASEREIGGLGIFMTKKLMNKVNYEYQDSQNILHLVKLFDDSVQETLTEE